VDIGFHEGRLQWARVRSDDSGFHPRDVPLDIGQASE
jgi:hypothetical protein